MAIAILNSPAEWVAHFGVPRKPTAITIGNFDGVHVGHQRILWEVTESARSAHATSAVLTFFPHPTRVLRPEAAPGLLETLPQRLTEFDRLGIDAALVLKFDNELARKSAESFAQSYLLETLRARSVFVGANFRFGHKQAGDVNLLTQIGRQGGFDVQVIEPVVLDGVVVSSSAIRNALREGRVEEAARMLGHPFALEGKIQTGTGLGRKLVVATLNLATEQETLPKNGVYATEVVVGGKTYKAVTNVGVRPTFDGKRLAIESHLFDFSETWTSGAMTVNFLSRLREERKFSGPDTLRAQILKDIEEARALFRKPQITNQ
ncbi:MAG: bifunctional riboflavin kinase/FAD synthetase [Candidatus Acidiferrales bacterium]